MKIGGKKVKIGGKKGLKCGGVWERLKAAEEEEEGAEECELDAMQSGAAEILHGIQLRHVDGGDLRSRD